MLPCTSVMKIEWCINRCVWKPHTVTDQSKADIFRVYSCCNFLFWCPFRRGDHSGNDLSSLSSDSTMQSETNYVGLDIYTLQWTQRCPGLSYCHKYLSVIKCILSSGKAISSHRCKLLSKLSSIVGCCYLDCYKWSFWYQHCLHGHNRKQGNKKSLQHTYLWLL